MRQLLEVPRSVPTDGAGWYVAGVARAWHAVVAQVGAQSGWWFFLAFVALICFVILVWRFREEILALICFIPDAIVNYLYVFLSWLFTTTLGNILLVLVLFLLGWWQAGLLFGVVIAAAGAVVLYFYRRWRGPEE